MSWPNTVRDILEETGIVNVCDDPIDYQVFCLEPDCDWSCWRTPIPIPDAKSGGMLLYITCPRWDDIGPIPVDNTDWRCRQVNLSALLDLIDQQLHFDGLREEVLPNTVWWLGRFSRDGKGVDIFFMRGVDTSHMALTLSNIGRFAECDSPVILVPINTPPKNQKSHYTFISLQRCLYLQDNGAILFDRSTVDGVSHHTIKRLNVINEMILRKGTNWDEVIFEFVSNEIVHIVARDIQEYRSYEELGFANMRNNNKPPLALWNYLLFMAVHDGWMAWSDLSEAYPNKRFNAGRWIADISTLLKQSIKNTTGTLFKYHEGKGYQATFKIYISEQLRNKLRL